MRQIFFHLNSLEPPQKGAIFLQNPERASEGYLSTYVWITTKVRFFRLEDPVHKNMKAFIPFMSYDAPHLPKATSNNTTSHTSQTRQGGCLPSFKRSVLRRGNSVGEREVHAVAAGGEGRGPPVAFAHGGRPSVIPCTKGTHFRSHSRAMGAGALQDAEIGTRER